MERRKIRKVFDDLIGDLRRRRRRSARRARQSLCKGDAPDLAMPSPCVDGMYQLASDNEQGLGLRETEVLITGEKIARARDLLQVESKDKC